MSSVKIGVIGCGNISNVYLESGKKFDILDIVAVADLDEERAKAKAAEHGIARALPVEMLLADPEIEIVINLTVPTAHYEVCNAILEAGKHAYVEKPLSVTRAQGRDLAGSGAGQRAKNRRRTRYIFGGGGANLPQTGR